jgi:hypothetical protein
MHALIGADRSRRGITVLALALLILLKTAIDLGAHLAERRKHGTLPSDQAVFGTTSS